MKRYDLLFCQECGSNGIEPCLGDRIEFDQGGCLFPGDDKGDFVLFEDHQAEVEKLMAENAALRRLCEIGGFNP